MGLILCHGSKVRFTKEVLQSELFVDDSYWQLEKVENDLRSILC